MVTWYKSRCQVREESGTQAVHSQCKKEKFMSRYPSHTHTKKNSVRRHKKVEAAIYTTFNGHFNNFSILHIQSDILINETMKITMELSLIFVLISDNLHKAEINNVLRARRALESLFSRES